MSEMHIRFASCADSRGCYGVELWVATALLLKPGAHFEYSTIVLADHRILSMGFLVGRAPALFFAPCAMKSVLGMGVRPP